MSTQYTRTDMLYDKYDTWRIARRFDIAHAISCFVYAYNCDDPIIHALQAKLDRWQFRPSPYYHYDGDALEDGPEREYYLTYEDLLAPLLP